MQHLRSFKYLTLPVQWWHRRGGGLQKQISLAEHITLARTAAFSHGDEAAGQQHQRDIRRRWLDPMIHIGRFDIALDFDTLPA